MSGSGESGLFWVSAMIMLPWLGAALQAFLPASTRAQDVRSSAGIALLASLLSSALALAMVGRLSPLPDLQFNGSIAWIASYAIRYDVGIDGLSAPLIALVAIVFPILITFEWKQPLGKRGIVALFLILQGALLGALCAQDLFIQFVFWGLASVPLSFLTGIWGGEKREQASMQVTVASAVGNALFFAAILLVYYAQDPHTFSLRELTGGKLSGKTVELLGTSIDVGRWALGLIALGLALRAPIWPLHGWFMRFSEEAPFTVLVAMVSAVVPIALYLLARLSFSLFPELMIDASRGLVVCGLLNLCLGVLCAVSQRDLRSLLAYASLAQVGLALIGMGSLHSAGWVGAVVQWLTMGLALAGVGLIFGMISQRSGHSEFVRVDGERGFGGLFQRAPGISAVFSLVLASLLGVPGTAGFVAFSLLVIGSYSVHPVTVAILGMCAVVLGYVLMTLYRLVFLGKPTGTQAAFTEITWREKAALFPLLVALVVLGVYPRPLVDLVRPTVLTLLSMVPR